MRGMTQSPRAARSTSCRVVTSDDQSDDDDGPGWGDPRWDDERWTITEPETFEPEPSDLEWSAGLPSDEDLEAMARHAAWLDHLEGLSRMTDEDLLAAGLPVG